MKNPEAEVGRPDSLQFVTPEQAKLKDINELFCPDPLCPGRTRRMYLKRSKNSLLFFCHFGTGEHATNPETLLHKMAIRAFLELDIFEIPNINMQGVNYPASKVTLNKSKTVIEYRLTKGIVPDVVLESIEGFRFAVEIYVTNPTKEEKIKKLVSNDLPTLEIDLNSFYKNNIEDCRTDLAFIKSHVFDLVNDLKLKTWLRPPLDSGPLMLEKQKTLPDNTGCLVAILAAPFELLNKVFNII